MTKEMKGFALVPHRCRYGHKWAAPMQYNYYYPNPLNRFCYCCLEEGRIEVGSIQICIPPMYGATIEYTCPRCAQPTRIPLAPDPSFTTMSLLNEDMEKWREPRLDWYHLPERWPTMCGHPATLPVPPTR